MTTWADEYLTLLEDCERRSKPANSKQAEHATIGEKENPC